MSTNMLSMIGRMGYASNMALYPLTAGTFYFVWKQYSTKAAVKQEAADRAVMPQAKAVDPDHFNPFSAIPFHNNPELHYRYADMKMHNYLDAKNHLNIKDYSYKGYHDSFDHDGEKEHLYNWVNMVPSHNA